MSPDRVVEVDPIADCGNDFGSRGDQVLVWLGEPPSPIRKPLAGLLLELIGNRQSVNTVNRTAAGCSGPASRTAYPPLGSRPWTI
ncbi:hypothetical protein [Nocardia sputi]|uniref:hypothetical protein n=1 Tax=Nocardia sputi TaxID=2943705 RepID=UPI00135A9B29|nr:hypothetical protein [Nocardia sputi]